MNKILAVLQSIWVGILACIVLDTFPNDYFKIFVAVAYFVMWASITYKLVTYDD